MAYPSTTSPKLPQINLSSSLNYDDVVHDPGAEVVEKKIVSAFYYVDLSIISGVLQFWAPVTSPSGRRLLTTCCQPVSYNYQDSCVPKYEKYRLKSWRYVYRIDDDDDDDDDDADDDDDDDDDDLEVEKESLKIISGPIGNAFVNRLAEAVMDMSVEPYHVQVQGCPLMSFALKYEFKSYFVLPVFWDPPCPTTSKPSGLSSSSTSCVGVVECCMHRNDDYFKLFAKLTYALKSVGLIPFHVQESPPYKTLPGFKSSINEIEKALRYVGEGHDLTAAQVWVPYKNDEHNSSSEVTHAVKLTGYCVDMVDSRLELIRSYCYMCDILPLKIGDGLVSKTLQTYDSHFSTNIFELRRKEQMRHMNLLGLHSIAFKSSFFAICLRSIDTGDLDYVFEFLWPRSRNYLILLDSLLLTLKKCLPSFKFADGTEIGDEIRVLDVGNSTGSGIGFFNIREGNGLSPVPKSLEKTSQVAEDCFSSNLLPQGKSLGRSMDEAATNLSGWQRPNSLKRKVSDVYDESESDSNEEDQDVLTLQVEYADDVFKLHLPISLETIEAVKNEINKICKVGTYKIKYLDEDEDWILMNTDKHVRHFIGSWRTSNGASHRLRVLPLTR